MAPIVVVIGLLGLFVPAAVSARQIGEEDRVRLAAFSHLATSLFPADTASSLAYCVAIRDEREFEMPPEGPGRDPDMALLEQFRRIVPRLVVESECVDPDGERSGADAPPVMYSIGAPRQSGSTMRIPVSYRVSRAGGGGWSCDVALRAGGWRVTECLPTWIS